MIKDIAIAAGTSIVTTMVSVLCLSWLQGNSEQPRPLQTQSEVIDNLVAEDVSDHLSEIGIDRQDWSKQLLLKEVGAGVVEDWLRLEPTVNVIISREPEGKAKLGVVIMTNNLDCERISTIKCHDLWWKDIPEKIAISITMERKAVMVGWDPNFKR